MVILESKTDEVHFSPMRLARERMDPAPRAFDPEPQHSTNPTEMDGKLPPGVFHPGRWNCIRIGSLVVPFCGWYLGP